MQQDKPATIGFIDILLLLGCLGVIEMLVTIFFWDEIAHSQSLKFLRPDQPLETLSVIALIAGLLGLFNYLFDLFTESGRQLLLRRYSAVVFIIGLVLLGIAYLVY